MTTPESSFGCPTCRELEFIGPCPHCGYIRPWRTSGTYLLDFLLEPLGYWFHLVTAVSALMGLRADILPGGPHFFDLLLLVVLSFGLTAIWIVRLIARHVALLVFAGTGRKLRGWNRFAVAPAATSLVMLLNYFDLPFGTAFHFARPVLAAHIKPVTRLDPPLWAGPYLVTRIDTQGRITRWVVQDSDLGGDAAGFAFCPSGSKYNPAIASTHSPDTQVQSLGGGWYSWVERGRWD